MKTLRMILVLGVAALGGAAWGTTFYVPGDGTLQEVIDRADCLSGDAIEIAAGTYSGPGYLNVDLRDKNLVVRSTDPDDAAVVAATVIDCQSAGRAFVLQGGQTPEAQVAGLTLLNGKGSLGGAIYINSSSAVTISRCVISACSGTLGGAIGISNAGEWPVIERCQLVGNSATAGGGAVYITGSSPIIKNCIISDNTAPRAGAIYSQNAGAPVVSQCTLTNNAGGSGGGAIWCFGGSNMTLNGSILWGNTATAAAAMLVGGAGTATVVDVSYCDVQGLNTDILVYAPSTLSGVGNIEADPMFAEGDRRLMEGSLCIDAGDPAYAAENEETDVYGDARMWGEAVDIGAAEYFVEEVNALEAQVRMWPKVINLRGHQNFLFCTIQLEGCESEAIDVESIVLGEDLAPIWAKKFKSVKELVVRFDMNAVAEMVMDGPEDTVTLTVAGVLLDGTPFQGSDTVKVYEKQWHWSKYIANHIKDHKKDRHQGKDAKEEGKANTRDKGYAKGR